MSTEIRPIDTAKPPRLSRIVKYSHYLLMLIMVISLESIIIISNSIFAQSIVRVNNVGNNDWNFHNSITDDQGNIYYCTRNNSLNVTCMNKDLQILWSYNYNVSNIEPVSGMTYKNGKLYISAEQGTHVFFLVLDLSGNILFSKLILTGNTTFASTVMHDDDILVASSYNPSLGCVQITRLTPAFTIVWSKRITFPGRDFVYIDHIKQFGNQIIFGGSARLRSDQLTGRWVYGAMDLNGNLNYLHEYEVANTDQYPNNHSGAMDSIAPDLIVDVGYTSNLTSGGALNTFVDAVILKIRPSDGTIVDHLIFSPQNPMDWMFFLGVKKLPNGKLGVAGSHGRNRDFVNRGLVYGEIDEDFKNYSFKFSNTVSGNTLLTQFIDDKHISGRFMSRAIFMTPADTGICKSYNECFYDPIVDTLNKALVLVPNNYTVTDINYLIQDLNLQRTPIAAMLSVSCGLSTCETSRVIQICKQQYIYNYSAISQNPTSVTNLNPNSAQMIHDAANKTIILNPIQTGIAKVVIQTRINVLLQQIDTIVFDIIDDTLTMRDLGPDLTLCYGDSVNLSFGFDSTHWFDGSVGNSITVKSAGTYWGSYFNDCKSASDSIQITAINCPPATCTLVCNNIEWMDWSQTSTNKYSGKTQRGSATLDFDPLTGIVNTGLYNVTLASNVFTPKNINSIPTPFMPGINGITTLIHKVNFDSINDPSEAFVLVGEFPNSQNPVFSMPQVGKLRAYDKMNIQLDLPDICEVFQDPLSSFIFSPTQVNYGKNEITFSVDYPVIADGGLVILKGFPSNTSYLEIEHFDELSSQWDGIYINVGLPDCCTAAGISNISIIPCTGDTNTYTVQGDYTFLTPPTTGNIIITIDNGIAMTISPPFTFPLNFSFAGLIPDGKVHTITISTSDFSDCFETLTFTAPLPPAPPLITTYPPICENSLLLIETDPGVRYSWSGPNNFSSILQNVVIPNVNSNNAGRYFVTVTNNEGCISTASVDINILKISRDSIYPFACDSITINNQFFNLPGLTLTRQLLTNSNQCDSLLDLFVVIQNHSTSNLDLNSCDSIIVNGQVYTQTGNYMQLLSNANGCDSTLNINLTIYDSTSFDLIQKSCDSAIINTQTYTQSGSYLQLLKNANGCDSFLNLILTIPKSTNANQTLKACDSITINAVKYTASGSYQQRLINANGCDSILKLDLTINPTNPSSLEAGKDTSICYGEIVNLNGMYSGQAIFSWQSTYGTFDQPDKLNTNYYPNSIGDHRIFLFSENDCSKLLDSLNILVLPQQLVQVTGDTLLNPCQEITFVATGGTNYTWTPPGLIECLDPACTKVRLKSPGSVTFTITTNGPCAEPAFLNLSVLDLQSDIYLPNVFTPNGDNINDFFLPIINCDKLEYYNLQIFDRWGNMVFESTNKDIGWNGKFRSENLSPAVFAYVVEYQFPGSGRKIRAGDVTLIR